MEISCAKTKTRHSKIRMPGLANRSNASQSLLIQLTHHSQHMGGQYGKPGSASDTVSAMFNSQWPTVLMDNQLSPLKLVLVKLDRDSGLSSVYFCPLFIFLMRN